MNCHKEEFKPGASPVFTLGESKPRNPNFAVIASQPSLQSHLARAQTFSNLGPTPPRACHSPSTARSLARGRALKDLWQGG